MTKKKVDNGHCRHKCSACGRVRYQEFMEQLFYPSGAPAKTRYGNFIWFCSLSRDCQQFKKNYFVY